VRYFHEPRPGISHARNTAIRVARGRLIAFIDDDELPGQDWLARLVRAQQDFAADVVIGPVYPRFGAPLERFPGAFERAFTYASDRATGTLMAPPSAMSLVRRDRCYQPMATCNALFVKSRCVGRLEPFDPELGQTGGEDVLFCLDLYFSGRKVVWCREALVWDCVQPERLNLRYILKRRFRSGQTSAFVCVKLRPPHWLRLVEFMIIGLFQTIIAGLVYPLLLMIDRERSLRALGMCVGGLGKVFWMKAFRPHCYGVGASP
jgi:succinoglycan biosynthesis protein ExoM